LELFLKAPKTLENNFLIKTPKNYFLIKYNNELLSEISENNFLIKKLQKNE